MRHALPIDSFLPQIAEALAQNRALVLSAAPGAGKTTRVPVELMRMTDKEVWVLEPRRVAAVAAAARISEENGFTLGREVGYQVRFENCSSRETRLLFLTEALLLRKLLQDPELSRVGCIVLDEFHERSLHVDLALGALKELQELSRPDLKIVVMSATLDGAALSQYMGGAPMLQVPGKVFPLTTRYDEKSQLLQTGPDFFERMRGLIAKAVKDNAEGDLLCFLPGRGEIERLRFLLEESFSPERFIILGLHGQLSLAEQKAALLPARGRQKIILATNVAESSLTVEGIRIVVDSGLARVQRLHPRTGFESLQLSRICKASATQRAGRAARQGPGIVYRAWTPHDELSMTEFEVPEVRRVDLAETVLLLAALGVSNPEAFSWFEAPPPRPLEQAQKFLSSLGAIASDGSLTSLGRRLHQFPLHPRLAKLLLIGKEKGVSGFAADLAALLSEGKGARSDASASGHENDLLIRLTEWKRSGGRFRSLDRAARQLRDLIGTHELEQNPSDRLVEEILLEVYPDRLCRRRQAGSDEAKMAGGRGVRLHPSSSVRQSEYFFAVELSEGRDLDNALVFQAVGLSENLVREKIEPVARSKTTVEFTDNKFWAIQGKEWNEVSVGPSHRRPASPEEVRENLVNVAFARWSEIASRNETLTAWLNRLDFLAQKYSQFSALSESQIREGLEMACFGENSLEPLFTKPLVAFFESLLSEEHAAALERHCPASWVVPSGNRFRIQYSKDQGPLVEVRLQELFGLPASPSIAGQALTLVLLAPNFRPVQVTRDLASFWKNTYPEVRKEMRARYPKHSWPEDPLAAEPQSKGRPRGVLPREI